MSNSPSVLRGPVLTPECIDLGLHSFHRVAKHTARGWVLLAGDAAWHTVQIDNLRQKAGFPGNLVDDDRAETFRTLHRLHLARHRVRIVPTHDHDAAHLLAAPDELG